MSFRYYSYLCWLRMDIPSEFRYLAKVGKSHAYVCGRLRLTQLIPEVKQAFHEAKLTVAHASASYFRGSPSRRMVQRGC